MRCILFVNEINRLFSWIDSDSASLSLFVSLSLFYLSASFSFRFFFRCCVFFCSFLNIFFIPLVTHVQQIRLKTELERTEWMVCNTCWINSQIVATNSSDLRSNIKLCVCVSCIQNYFFYFFPNKIGTNCWHCVVSLNMWTDLKYSPGLII